MLEDEEKVATTSRKFDALMFRSRCDPWKSLELIHDSIAKSIPFFGQIIVRRREPAVDACHLKLFVTKEVDAV